MPEISENQACYKMLEIKNVSKIYSAKGGANTHALNDVSISFGETGLVFLLGKSGSGKSTLLNISGGLDEPTSGEVIVKGKSSKDFTGSDFDSYRNTFVGFIFQEYNILDEFNVEDNIALALELQGKPKDKQKINSILRDVELEAFAKRKPNTLSGGQKQRIAIARALVKEPQIIMADEPTGALDSATGKQVFDTLKALSKTRLVIVVSHDREFAEIYGDRIVELADGKIISDVTKTHVAADVIDENVAVIGENTLSIKSGASLTKENFKTIQDFISKSEGDVIISKGEKEISSFKKVNRVSESGSTEKFENTDGAALTDKNYSAEESKFIRSRLPVGKAIKIGASSLKLKPVRLVFTIFLSVVAFIMFGITSTLMFFNESEVLVSSFVNGDSEYIALSKQYEIRYIYDSVVFPSSQSAKFTQEEYDQMVEKFGSSVIGFYQYESDVSNISVSGKNQAYYSRSVSKVTVLPENHSLRSSIIGAYPKTADEICISDYFLEVLKNNSYYNVTLNENGVANQFDTDDILEIRSANDIIGKYIVCGSRPFKVTGVFGSGQISAKFDKLKENLDLNSQEMYRLKSEYENYLKEGLKTAFLVDEGFTKYLNKWSGGYPKEHLFYNFHGGVDFSMDPRQWNDESMQFVDCGMQSFHDVYEANVYGSKGAFEGIFFGGQQKSQLADDEVLLSLRMFFDRSMTSRIIEYYMSFETGENDYENYLAASTRYNKELEYYFNIIQKNEIIDKDTGESSYCTKQQYDEAVAKLTEIIESIQPIEINASFGGGAARKMKLVGFYKMKNMTDMLAYNDSGVYFSQNFFDENLEINNSSMSTAETNYVWEDGQKYNGLLISYDKSEKLIRDAIGISGVENKKANDVYYTISNDIALSVSNVSSMIEILSTVFLWVGVVLALFSSLLLFNFISVSISNKRKEIGILRAVGARGIDVFKIFFAESGIIVGICLIISLIGSVLLCGVINKIIMEEVGLAVTLFVFGVASVGILIGIAVLVAFISTFLPVYFAARKKPVESIRAL